MAKVQFQVDGLDANTASIFNSDVTFDGNVDAASISIGGVDIFTAIPAGPEGPAGADGAQGPAGADGAQGQRELTEQMAQLQIHQFLQHWQVLHLLEQ
jgi:hypothetical protein